MISLLGQVVKLEKDGHINSALDYLYETTDLCLADGLFDMINRLFYDAEKQIEDLDINIALGILTTTLPIKNSSIARKHFYDAFEKELEKRNKALSQGLLQGLE